MRTPSRHILILLLAGFLTPGVLHAQLISPGELIEAHAEWDRIDSCTTCHALGNRGIEDTKCLSCHSPIDERLEQGLGLHATFDPIQCATCHKDHFGRDFDAIRFDTTAFDHDLTGFELVQSHTEATCSSCHTPDHIADASVLAYLTTHEILTPDTYLGTVSTCFNCHRDDDVHGDQFVDTACSDCHDSDVWTEAPVFDHDEARYPLTGMHTDVACVDCHEPSPTDPDMILYRPRDFAQCSSCHEDSHDGKLGATCSSCHQTSGWDRMVSGTFEEDFDHDLTGFALLGRHEPASCDSCHGQGPFKPGVALTFLGSGRDTNYPHPESGSCQSCHLDAHEGGLESIDPIDADCASCHTESMWTPSLFDGERHASETTYPLEGAHLAVLCSQCHESITDAPIDPPEWRLIDLTIPDATCNGCHSDDDPHDGQFEGESCESCHAVDNWLLVQRTFNHATTSFLLEGAHTRAVCTDCHSADPGPAILFRGMDTSCASCHEEESIHDGQFAPDGCQSCHDSESFRIPDFDHDTTGWPLEGVHAQVTCASCHTSRLSRDGLPIIEFRGIGSACADCHGGELPND